MIKKIPLIIFALLLSFVVCNGQVTNKDRQTNQTENSPLSYGIVIDNSGSYRVIFEQVLKAANEIIESNESDDEAFVVRFVDSDKIYLLQDFTSSKDDLLSATEDLFIEGGQTAILDAVYFAAQHLAENENARENRRKVLILITDGEDRSSRYKIGEVLKFLKDEKIQVYTLGLSAGKVYKNLLEKLAKETDGKSFIAEKRSDIGATVKQLAAALRER